MRVVIAGGSGFIGEALVQALEPRSDVFVLSRNAARVRHGKPLVWNPGDDGGWRETVAGADVVINLAGESIADGRWTESRKRALEASRLTPTRALVQVLRDHPLPRRTFISASAIGYYGDREDEILDERSAPGSDFLAALSIGWEAAAREAESHARVVVPRISIVLAPHGGALSKMILPFRLFAGGPMGSGRQWMSWIDLDDLVAMFLWFIDNDATRGVYNATAPEPVTNREFARALGRALHRPAIVPAPRIALRLLLGEMADALLLGGQRVIPRRALADGLSFRATTVEASRALRSLRRA